MALTNKTAFQLQRVSINLREILTSDPCFYKSLSQKFFPIEVEK